MSGGGAAGAGIGAFGSIYSGTQKQAAYDTAAAHEEQNSQLALQEGQWNMEKQFAIGEQRSGKIQAGYGASGVTQSGSAADVLAAAHAASEIDQQNVYHQAFIQSQNYINQEHMDETAGQSAFTAGILGAVGSGFQGASGVGSNYTTKSKSDDESYEDIESSDPQSLGASNNDYGSMA